MDPLTLIACGVFSLLSLLSALWVVTLRNIFRAALSLGLTLVGVAGLFLILGAEFLAFVQILVYVGAILTLIVFAIMLTSRPQAGGASAQAPRQPLPAALVSLILFGVLVAATRPLMWPRTSAAAAVSTAELGQQLVTTLVLPFEVISLAFVAVAIGAIVLAAERRSTQPLSR